ncbi:MAG: hypothetical protein J6I84_03775 [Bacilli bacterium]|nr:hypothetical protein [Bacilli bacterium]
MESTWVQIDTRTYRITASQEPYILPEGENPGENNILQLSEVHNFIENLKQRSNGPILNSPRHPGWGLKYINLIRSGQTEFRVFDRNFQPIDLNKEKEE